MLTNRMIVTLNQGASFQKEAVYDNKERNSIIIDVIVTSKTPQ